MLAFWLWAGAERPTLLISGDGTLVGLMTEAGRALSKEKGGGFIAKNWLEDDGDASDQIAAAARPGFTGKKGDLTGVMAARTVRVFAGKGGAARAAGSCADGALVILSEDWAGAAGDCLLFDRKALAASGAVAVYGDGGDLRLVEAKVLAGDRLWNRRPAAQHRSVAADAP